ncbi:hypothetical protein AB0M28_09105, partial [Streptomyces sp. NPDC051940]|uniref:Acg family FMN-binding oxidoreductase n=1 Tax=Streptomyces sp. NPDC051940 TaxID=3155675 RepID=UPI003433A5EE
MTAAQFDAGTLTRLISAAVAAPSMHNSQPWRYRLSPGDATLDVHAAPGRGLRHTDPMGRGLHVSVGAALYNLRVAAAHFGWESVVRLLPDPERPELLAQVRFAGPVLPGGHNRPDLYDAIWRRHSSRLPYAGVRPPESVLAELVAAAAFEGATLLLPDDAEARRLLQVTGEAEQRNVRDPERRAESRSWIREGARDGLTGASLGPPDATGRVPVRDFTGAPRTHALPAAVFEDRPVIAVLTTAHDRRADWLRAGQALEHVLLAATAHSVKASLLHQALEWPDLRWTLRGSPHSHVQMLLRLGYGPAGAATPRR